MYVKQYVCNHIHIMSQMLMTRAMKEKLALGDRRSSPAWGTVRVRMPEGLLLQGEFAALEPCTAVFVWLTDCLQDPGVRLRHMSMLPVRLQYAWPCQREAHAAMPLAAGNKPCFDYSQAAYIHDVLNMPCCSAQHAAC